jgi:prepilin-type N-terminal cleavage/methylation domain-containing protein
MLRSRQLGDSNYSRAAFTLLEMLVVIGIISILVAMLVVFGEPVQIKVREAVVKAHCKTIEDGLASYAANHQGLYPGFAIDINAPWPNYLMGDSTTDRLFLCPSQPYPEIYLKPDDNWPYHRAHPDMLVGEAITGGRRSQEKRRQEV